MSDLEKEKKIQSLFDDTKDVSFGCVFFDLKQIDGRSLAWPGSGWASIEGGRAFRVQDENDLDKNIIWLSNLKRDAWYKSNIFRKNNIKKSEYLKTDVGDVMKELQMIPQNITIAVITEQFSHMFNKIMRLCIELYNVSSFDKEDLILQLKDSFGLKDENLSIHVDEAFARSYQDMVICENNNINLTGYKRIALKRPRVIHARQILETQIPNPNTSWDILFNDDLPEDKEKRMSFLFDSNRPFICKVKINKFKDQKNSEIDFSKLLNLGEALGPKGVKKKRDWMTSTELLYYSKLSDITIEAAMIGDKYEDLQYSSKIPDFGPLIDLSYSYGLLAECVWHAYTDRSMDYQNKSKTLVSPRAAWLRASDRFYCLTSAMMLSSNGIQIISYGSGMVVVQIEDDKIKDLINLAPQAGLTVPIWLVEKYQLSKLIPG